MRLPEQYLKIPVTEVMDKNVVILDESTTINEAARIMETEGISSVLVSDSKSDSIKGIVTERDILYRAVAKNLGTFKVSIGSIISSPIVKIDKETPSIEAVMLMRTKGIRRLPVFDKGKVVGVVTLMSLVGNMPINNIELAELAVTQKSNLLSVSCPYCESKFIDKIELSRHIDRIHLGSGLLEGDLRKWK